MHTPFFPALRARLAAKQEVKRAELVLSGLPNVSRHRDTCVGALFVPQRLQKLPARKDGW